MNSYFFKMTNEERNNILDQHKELYNGFATNNTSPNQQPLYVQDFANDKQGVTVSNTGNVMSYKNMNINEDVYSGSEFTPEESFEEYVSLGEKLDMIGDGPNDLPNGTVDIKDDDDTLFTTEPDSMDIDKINSIVDKYFNGEDQEIDLSMINLGDEFDEGEKEKITLSIKESLDMFQRVKKYL